MIDDLPYSRSIRLGALVVLLLAIAQRAPATPDAGLLAGLAVAAGGWLAWTLTGAALPALLAVAIGGGLAAGSDAVAALFALLATAIAGDELEVRRAVVVAAAATAALGVAAAISDSGALLALAVVIAPAGLVTGLARRQYVLRVEQASCVSRTRRLAGRAEGSARPAGTRVVVADDQTAVRSRLRAPPVRPAGRAGRARRGRSRAVPARLR